jgi:hypothetical protein
MVTPFRLKTSTGQRSPGSDVVFVINYDELLKELKDLSQKSPLFAKEMKKASQAIAQEIVDRAKVNANAQPPHGKPRDGSSGHSQASQVVRGLRARRDRLPTIKLDHNKAFVSKSRSNKTRGLGRQGPGLASAGIKGFDRKVTYGDVFFGAEFGGRRRKTTQQFLRHRGRQGYFFWQAVRDSRSYIAKEYVQAIDDVVAMLGIGKPAR